MLLIEHGFCFNLTNPFLYSSPSFEGSEKEIEESEVKTQQKVEEGRGGV